MVRSCEINLRKEHNIIIINTVCIMNYECDVDLAS